MFGLVGINFALFNSLNLSITHHVGEKHVSKHARLPDRPTVEPENPPTVEPESGNGLVGSRAEPSPVPDAPGIDRVEEPDIGKEPLFVMHEEASTIPLFVLQEEQYDVLFDGVYPPCKLRLMGGGPRVEIVENEYWAISDPRIRFGKLKGFNGRAIRIPRTRMVSQAHRRSSSVHSVTLYRVQLENNYLSLAGQTCSFSDEVFQCLYLIALRSHRKRTTLRKVSLLVVPRKGGKSNGNT